MIKDQEFVLKLLREYNMADAEQIENARNAAMDAGSLDVVAELVKNKIFEIHFNIHVRTLYSHIDFFIDNLQHLFYIYFK